MKNRLRPEITSFSLHILAMACMLCDHLWGTIVPGNDWLTCVGRITFPLYAFMLVEGCFRTKDLKKYALRLLVCAVVSEIPFNLAMSGRVWYPVHQNVLWTLLISFGLIHLNEKARGTGKRWLRVLAAAGSLVLGFVLGLATFVDYHHAGIYMVLVFYFFRGRNWWDLLGQFLLLAYINTEILGGYTYELTVFGETVWLVRQSLALLALIPIWLYRGRQGPSGRAVRWLYYGFYPVHLLILGLLGLVL